MNYHTEQRMWQIINNASMDRYLFDDLLAFFEPFIWSEMYDNAYNTGHSDGWQEGFEEWYELGKK